MSDIGHNSGDEWGDFVNEANEAADASEADVFTKEAQHRLKTIIERVERLEEEKAAMAEDIKAVYAEAKGDGFDTKIIRKVIALRKRSASDRAEEEALIDLYVASIGGL